MRFQRLKELLIQDNGYSSLDKVIVDNTWATCADQYEILICELLTKLDRIETEVANKQFFKKLQSQDSTIIRRNLKLATDALEFYSTGDEPFKARQVLKEIQK